ncbi:5-(carboxyamino)imidazole ribonucleotide synthase [Anoxybacillus rupiensis]|jgi:5-(carboxyamino)imidazole ribonucleotide synthase|uniref:N5-carboxyaminoimidazole ribonucleotide synthase n=1 Tax=Anoxybacteroides rupiense TaxID=311460 RepID=A0ABD5J0C8_9BACL|nr:MULTISPECIES: 5-(carboxyamino)imidazole ribonucleotide synthase [Anoxybacillus]KXG09851.1 N5-carboxyaminoimidazole ribonucleotide synthase [Anoxybacillus sp. P3H1B]MBS2772107.1 5-(carboxyamino)imidazole ribonucleotide synthase [Anoxybacillus rupiensis]MDE8563507.1 5-(carboxyamino)imidazole ribonucleotide synthase [Anoxybacillus rupiensis]MED5053455.1 5-(carboxyamino)imidazole ribonucleotide synthase [Anoxybacillus rupiensis]QHC05695.1 5-(carboxyamino)imidazole ribonucleotide synthase [Anoxy
MILNNQMIVPGQTIGIIGGGQLGRMMAIAAKEMGFRIAVLDPIADSPCGQVADIEITGEYSDLSAIQKLAEVSDVITYEFENIDAAALDWLVSHSYVPQGSKLLMITQDRATEKQAIVTAGLPVAPYQEVQTKEELVTAVDAIGLPCVLKTCRGGYDGKGQFVIRSKKDVQAASLLLQSGHCVLEGWVSFEKEVSVIVSRNGLGDMKVFPVAENIHLDNILHQTIVPARMAEHIAQKAIAYAERLATYFELVGTLAVEMFLTSEGDIYINELAPRPHNSGHYTINACVTSQFQQHIRAICNWPLSGTELLKPAVMVNILGEHLQPVIDCIAEMADMHLHLYGKKEAKHKRKMGHVTLLAENVDAALQRIDDLKIWMK